MPPSESEIQERIIVFRDQESRAQEEQEKADRNQQPFALLHQVVAKLSRKRQTADHARDQHSAAGKQQEAAALLKNARAALSEKVLGRRPDFLKRSAEEKPPAKEDRDQRPDMAEESRHAFPLLKHIFFKEQQEAVVQAPQQEVPGGPVPETRQRPDNKDVQHMAELSDPIAAERDVNIFAEPGPERNVPAPPEFRNAFRGIGQVEVFREVEAQHHSQSDRHIRIT